jgi:hypothetical protein
MCIKVIDNRIVTVEAGSVVELGDSRIGRKLLPCTDWDKAMFRWPNPIPEWEVSHAIAVDFQITGRTFVRRHGSYYVKLKTIWVGDGEPNTYGDGWLLVGNEPWTTLPYADESV